MQFNIYRLELVGYGLRMTAIAGFPDAQGAHQYAARLTSRGAASQPGAWYVVLDGRLALGPIELPVATPEDQ